jgi:SAM-dependent methyltransferase
MGLNYYTAREILRARCAEALGDVVTIGRLQQFLLPDQVKRLKQLGAPDGDWARTAFGEFADPFFEAAGARSLRAIDASRYEGASLIHDMNEPLPLEMTRSFDLVVDGGSLEHVFRVDTALANDMRLLRPGGHLIVWAPSNNQCGHGFYQFSPEFFFRALHPGTGFELQRVMLAECIYPAVSLLPPRRAVEVSDPAEVRSRVGAQSHRPLMLLVHAVKRAHVEDPFAQAPQQSDYELEWQTDDGAPVRPLTERSRSVARRVSGTSAGLRFRNHLLGIRQMRKFSLKNERFFVQDRDTF